MEDLHKEDKAGATVGNVQIILDETDGCSEQYRCGSALFLLWKYAIKKYITHDRAVDCAGHKEKED